MTVLVYYVKLVPPLEGSQYEYPPNQKIVGMWNISEFNQVTRDDLQAHSPNNADLARIFYISDN